MLHVHRAAIGTRDEPVAPEAAAAAAQAVLDAEAAARARVRPTAQRAVPPSSLMPERETRAAQSTTVFHARRL